MIKQARFTLMVLVLAHAALAFDALAISVALPEIQRDLGMTDAGRQWTIAAFALAVAALLPVSGRVTDAIGSRKAMILSSIGFAVALAGVASATASWQMVVSRALEGVAVALLIPATYSMIIATFPGRRARSLAIGVLATAGSVGAACGGLLAGLLVDFSSWRVVFVISCGIVVVVALGTLFGVSGGRAGYPVPIDIAGTITITCGLFGIVFGLARAGGAGWGEGWTQLSFWGGLGLCAAFLMGQARSKRPLVPLTIFRDRDRAGAMLAMFGAGFGGIGTTVYLTFHMTLALGYSGAQVGVTFVIQLVVQSIVTTFVVMFAGHRVGPRILVPAGLVVSGLGAACIAVGGSEGGYFEVILPAVLAVGMGSGLLYSAVANTAVLHLEHGLIGVASAVANSVLQLGAAIGAAALGSISAQLDGSPNYVAPIWAAAASFLLAGVVSACVLRSGPLHEDRPPARRAREPRRVSIAAVPDRGERLCTAAASAQPPQQQKEGSTRTWT